MARIETVVFYNPKAPKKAREVGQAIKGPDILHVDQIADLQIALRYEPSRVIPVGGEGTTGLVIQELYDQLPNLSFFPHVGIIPGGKQNVLFKEARRAGRAISVSDFARMPTGELPKDHLFRPAKAGGIIIINQFDTGMFSVINGEKNEVFRGTPFKIPTAVRTLAAFEAARISGKKMDLYSVVAHIGKVDVFPGFDSFGPEIAHAVIEGDHAALKLISTLLLWHFGIQPLQSLVKREIGREFVIESDEEKAWTNGDTRKNPIRGHGKDVFARVDEPIPVTALVG